MFVLEAPSFVVPYVYEKPAKESFKEFKDSLEKIIDELKEKAKIEKKEEEGDDDVEMEEKEKEEKEKEGGKEKKEEKEKEKEKEKDEVTEVSVPAPPKPVALNPFFETSVGKFVVDLGMNMVQEMVQQDLLKELTKKSYKDKSVQMMRSIASLKSNLVIIYDEKLGHYFLGIP